MTRIWLAAAFLVVALACGAKPAAPPAPAASPSPTPTPAAAAKPAPAPRSAPAVAFEHLLPLLPEVDGWTRSAPRGEQVAAGVPMSRASARYESGESAVDVEVLDSAFHELVLAPIASYLTAGFNERMSHGYRKAAAMNGHPGFEEWNSDRRRAQVTVVVGERFIVNATGRSVDSTEPVRGIVQKIALSQIAALK